MSEREDVVTVEALTRMAQRAEPAGDVVTVDLSNRALMAELSFAWSHGWPGSIELSDIIRSHAIPPTPEPCPTPGSLHILDRVEALERDLCRVGDAHADRLEALEKATKALGHEIMGLASKHDDLCRWHGGLERRYDLHHHDYWRKDVYRETLVTRATSCPVDPPE